MSKKCCVDGCSNADGIFHPFPLKLNYAKKSSITGGSADAKPQIETVNANLTMCGEHFRKQQTCPSGQLKIRVEPSLLKGRFKENICDNSIDEKSTLTSSEEDPLSEKLKAERITKVSFKEKSGDNNHSDVNTVVSRITSSNPLKPLPKIIIKRRPKRLKSSETVEDTAGVTQESEQIVTGNREKAKLVTSDHLKYTIQIDCGKIVHSWNWPDIGNVPASDELELVDIESEMATPRRRLKSAEPGARYRKTSSDLPNDSYGLVHELVKQFSNSRNPSVEDMRFEVVDATALSMSPGSEEVTLSSDSCPQDDAERIEEGAELSEIDQETAEDATVQTVGEANAIRALRCNCELRVPVYLCTKCNFGFYHESLLEYHYRTCSELECYKCRCVFESLNDIYLHVIECEAYVCRHCSATSIDGDQHRLHQQLCGEDVTMRCKRCDAYETIHAMEFEHHTKLCFSNLNLSIINPPKLIKSSPSSFTEMTDFPDESLTCPRCSAELQYDERCEESSVSTSYSCCCYSRFSTLQALLDHSVDCRLILAEQPGEISQNTKLTDVTVPKLECTFDDNSSIYDELPEDDTVNCLDKFYGEVEKLFAMLKRRSFKTERDTQCSVCKKTLGSKHKLQAHLERHSLQTLVAPHYVCTYCTEPFKELVSFNAHAKENHVMKRCDYCPFENPNSCSLDLHVTRDHLEYGENVACATCKEIVPKGDFIAHCDQRCGQTRKLCTVCGMVITGIQEYGLHVATHRRSSKSVTCATCKETVPKEDLIAHRKKYHDADDTMCGLCGLHKKVHVFGVCTGELQCPGCGKLLDRYLLSEHSCGTSNLLRKARRLKIKTEGNSKKLKMINRKSKMQSEAKYKNPKLRPEGREEKPKFTCVLCGKCFVKESCYTLHLKRHNGVKKPFRCNYCLTYFISMEALDGHNRALHRFQSAHCADCDLTFEDLEGYYTHRRDQHFKTKYLCCDKILSNFTIVLRHFQDDHQHDRMSIVTKLSNGKPTPFVYKLYVESDSDHIRFACATCNTVFSNKLRVNMHITNVHIGERKFRCSHCEASYKSRSSLNSHETIHFNVNPYNCRFCPQGFRTNRAWKKHELMMHEVNGQSVPQKRHRSKLVSLAN